MSTEDEPRMWEIRCATCGRVRLWTASSCRPRLAFCNIDCAGNHGTDRDRHADTDAALRSDLALNLPSPYAGEALSIAKFYVDRERGPFVDGVEVKP